MAQGFEMKKRMTTPSVKAESQQITLDQLREKIEDEYALNSDAEERLLLALHRMTGVFEYRSAPWSAAVVDEMKAAFDATNEALSVSQYSAYEVMRLQDREIAHYRKQLGLPYEPLFD